MKFCYEFLPFLNMSGFSFLLFDAPGSNKHMGTYCRLCAKCMTVLNIQNTMILLYHQEGCSYDFNVWLKWSCMLSNKHIYTLLQCKMVASIIVLVDILLLLVYHVKTNTYTVELQWLKPCWLVYPAWLELALGSLWSYIWDFCGQVAAFMFSCYYFHFLKWK